MASATTFRPRRMLVTPSEFAIESFEHPGQALTIARSVDLGSDVTVAVKPVNFGTGSRPQEIHAVFGIFRLLDGPYLAVVSRSTMLGTGPRKSRFYRVDRVDLLRFRPASRLAADAQRDERKLLKKIKSILNTKTFYFAENYDITQCAQNIARLDTEARAAGMLHNTNVAERANRRFFFNEHLLHPLIDKGDETQEWVTPCINGLVQVLPSLTIGAGVEFDLLFISRRACGRVGTRFNMRGVDQHGNAANFVETEQLLLHSSRSISSYVQTRGSIPVMWTQRVNLKYMPDSKLNVNDVQSQAAFVRHAEAQIEAYGKVLGVNLVDNNNKSGLQKQMGDAYDKAVERLGNDKFKVTWFDFHHECRKMQWHNLAKLVKRVDAAFDEFGYFQQDPAGNVVRQQTGVFRTNCMDNLDRTNVVQSLFARRFILKAVGRLEDQDSVLTSPFSSFEHSFKNAWADHADVLSKLYSGTGALKTDFTRTGKRTLAGKLQDGVRSVKRYFINNFADGHRQDGWDLFMAKYTPDVQDRRALRASARTETTGSFLRKLLLLFLALVAIAASFMPAGWSWRTSMQVGSCFAMVAFLFLCFLQLKKGVGIGKRLVTRPHFVPQRDV